MRLWKNVKIRKQRININLQQISKITRLNLIGKINLNAVNEKIFNSDAKSDSK